MSYYENKRPAQSGAAFSNKAMLLYINHKGIGKNLGMSFMQKLTTDVGGIYTKKKR
jgi:hypothetical protein